MLYGSEPRRFRRFEGACPDVNPLELPDTLAAHALNWDPDGSGVGRKRLGRTAYNSTAPAAARIWGVLPFYPPSANRITVMQAGTAVYADNNRDGDFGDAGEELATGLTGGRWMDLLQWRDTLYFGNGADAFRRSRFSSGVLQAATVVAILAAPAEALDLEPVQTQLEAFDTTTGHATDPTQGWVVSGSDWTVAAGSSTKDGTSVVFEAVATGARGSYRYKEWSSATKTVTTLGGGGVNNSATAWTVGSTSGFTAGDYLQVESEVVRISSVDSGTTLTVTRGAGGSSAAAHAAGVNVTKSVLDLSRVKSIQFWARGQSAKLQFQVGVRTNAGQVFWARHPTYTIQSAKTWKAYSITLEVIPPGSRNASMGLAVRFVDDGDQGFTGASKITFDDLKGRGYFEGTFRYYYTYAEADAAGNVLAESDPVTLDANGDGTSEVSPTSYTFSDDDPVRALTLTVPGTAASGVNKIRVYRIREGGLFRLPRLLTTLTNPGAGSTTTYTDSRTDEDLIIENAPEMVTGRIAPPLAYTYALVNNRLLAGAVTLSSVYHPYRLYLSRLGFPEEFSSVQDPEDPNSAGWVDIPTKDQIVRIVELDGLAVIFCNRSVWTLQGSGWDDFSLQKRADVGLDAREAVEPWGRLLFFLAHDGFRALAPHGGYEGSFETWVVSEPYDSRLEGIPAGYRQDCSTGTDHLGRVHLAYVRSGQTTPRYSLVFDPKRPGALSPAPNPARPGWTEYLWPDGYSAMAALKQGGGDYGQLLAGGYANGKLYYLLRDGAGADLETDDGGAVAWEWQSAAEEAPPGRKIEFVYTSARFEQGAVSQQVTHTPVLDGAVSARSYTQTGSGASTAGLQAPDAKRTHADQSANVAALKLSGSHSAAHTVRSAEYGRQAR